MSFYTQLYLRCIVIAIQEMHIEIPGNTYLARTRRVSLTRVLST